MSGRFQAWQVPVRMVVLAAVLAGAGGCTGAEQRRGAPVTPPASVDKGWPSVPAACRTVSQPVTDRMVGGSARPQQHGGSCTWSFQDITADISRSLTVEIQRFTGSGSVGPVAEAGQQFGSSRWRGGQEIRITGYGDEATLARGYRLDDRTSRLVVRTRNVVFAATVGSADTVLDRAYRALPFVELDTRALEVGREVLGAIGAPVPAAQPTEPYAPAAGAAPSPGAAPSSGGAARSSGATSSAGAVPSGSAGAAAPVLPAATTTAVAACAAVPETLVARLVPAAARLDATAADPRYRTRCTWQQFGTLPPSKLWTTVEMAIPAPQTGDDGVAMARVLVAALRGSVDGQPAAQQVQGADEAYAWVRGGDQERTVLLLARRGAALVEVRYTSGSGMVDSAHPAVPAGEMTASAVAVAAATMTAQQARTG